MGFSRALRAKNCWQLANGTHPGAINGKKGKRDGRVRRKWHIVELVVVLIFNESAHPYRELYMNAYMTCMNLVGLDDALQLVFRPFDVVLGLGMVHRVGNGENAVGSSTVETA